jgi:hypothetical protein
MRGISMRSGTLLLVAEWILARIRRREHFDRGWVAPDGKSGRQKRCQLLSQGEVDLGAASADENRRSHRPGLSLCNRLGIVPDHYGWDGAMAIAVNGNPNLKQEDALASELSGEYFVDKGRLRVSLFQERIKNAIFSQTGLITNQAVQSTFISNVGEIDTYGVEVPAEKTDAVIKGLDIIGNMTWVDSRIDNNHAAHPAAAALGPMPSKSQRGGSIDRQTSTQTPHVAGERGGHLSSE